jgi:hypothetical protein
VNVDEARSRETHWSPGRESVHQKRGLAGDIVGASKTKKMKVTIRRCSRCTIIIIVNQSWGS